MSPLPSVAPAERHPPSKETAHAAADTPDGGTKISLRTYLTRMFWLSVAPLVLLAAYLAVDHVRTL